MKKVFSLLFVLFLSIKAFSQVCDYRGAGNAFYNNGTTQLFSGFSNYEVYPIHAITGNITIEAWVWPEEFTNNATIISKSNLCQNEGNYRLFFNGTGHVVFAFSNGTNNFYFTSSEPVALQEWTHIALVSNFQNAGTWFYFNGRQITGTWNVTPSGTPAQPATPLTIGAVFIENGNCNNTSAGDYTYRLKGWIDEVKLWNTRLDSMEIRSWMDKTITFQLHPKWGNLRSYYDFNSPNNFSSVDRSSNNTSMTFGNYRNPLTFNGGVSGAPPVNAEALGCNGYALNLTSTTANTFASGIDTDVFDGLGGITVMVDIYPTSYPGLNEVKSIVCKGDYGLATTTLGLYLQNISGTNYLRANVHRNDAGLNANTATLAINASNLPLNQWSRIAFTWSNTDGLVRLWRVTGSTIPNAVSTNAVSGTTPNVIFPLRVGSSPTGAETNFNGLIDEVRIFNRALNGSEVVTYSSGPIGSNSPVYNNLIGYWRMDEPTGSLAVKDQSCFKNTLQLLGGATISGSLQPCGALILGDVLNVSASNNFLDKIRVKWEYPSNLPINLFGTNDRLTFQIYKDGALLTTVNANPYGNFYDDFAATCIHDYYVVPVWRFSNNTTSSGQPSTTATGRTRDINFEASNGAFVNKTTLTWANISSIATNGFEIKRDGQQIAIVSQPGATLFNDFDGIPGRRYVYEIKPLATGMNYSVCPDTGWIRENGRLNGYVLSPQQAPVANVIITATGTVDNQQFTYRDTTDASGFYEIRNVYYGQQATYTIVPSRGTRGFSPASAQRTLDVQSFTAPQANFIDTSVFTVEGKITFPDQNNNSALGCPIEGVTILVNGIDRNIKTNAQGIFRISIDDEGTYTFTPKFKHHTFSPASTTLFVDDNIANLNFTDIETDFVTISLTGYCGEQLADSTFFEINAINSQAGCYVKPISVKGNIVGGEIFELPAQRYLIIRGNVVSGDANMNTQIQTYGDFSKVVDLFVRDTVTVVDSVFSEPTFVPADTVVLSNGNLLITPADTLSEFLGMDTVVMAVEPVAEFLYGGKLISEILGLDSVSNCDKIVLQQGTPYNIQINVFREYSFTSVLGGNAIVSTCPLDNGKFTLFDEISDAGQANFNITPTDNGRVRYIIVAGKPNTIAVDDNPNTTTIDESAYNFQKFLRYVVEAQGVPVQEVKEVWAYVLGNKELTTGFITKTPELPLFILHDPPGDGSYASITDGTSFTNNYSNSVYTGSSTNTFLNMQIGTEFTIPFTAINVGVFGVANISTTSSTEETRNKSVDVTFSVSNSYSTSAEDDFVGEDADLVTGASLNIIYGLSAIIDFDTASCSATIDTALTWGSDGFATTYTYTIGHIKNTLLPQLTGLRDLYNNRFIATFDTLQRDSARLLQTYIDVWQQVVDKNRENIDNAEFIENRSFSGGAQYANTTNYENSETLTIDYTMAIDLNTTLALGFGYGDFTEVSSGVDLLFQWAVSKSTSTSSVRSKEIAYVLTDKNPGDVFTVDIKRDKVYGTPAFQLVAGASSCPHEPNTQRRDAPDIRILNSPQLNVPANQQAVFTAQLTNLSETGETRTYNVIVDPASNLEGAIIRLGGQLVSQFPATFTIPPGSVFATLTVEKGPVAATYNDLKLIIYSPCDEDQQAEATFGVTFQNECSPISIIVPNNNWLINDNNNNILEVTYGNYNLSNPNLVGIGLEIRRPGQNWQNINTVSVATLRAGNFAVYGIAVNVSSLPDGAYELRAYAQCSTTVTTRNYSPVFAGTIDRKSATLFGTPSPSDGVLNINEEISVTFSENIDCTQAFNQTIIGTPLIIQLRRNDTGAIVPSSFVCNGNKIIINTNPPALLDSLEGRTLTASVQNVYDLNGNVLVGPLTWSFVVNRSKVFWQPSGIVINVAQGTTTTATGTLVNSDITTANYSINQSQLPAWLQLSSSNTGSINGGGSVDINFNVSGNQNIGTYFDSVMANFGGNNQKLNVQLNVFKPSPSYNVVQYPNSMSIIANFSLTQNNFPLSTDINDRIAVFAGNECRGVANLQYTQNGNAYAAFINVFGNGNELLTFRMWDASTGTEYEAIETQTFISGVTIGQVVAPFILHPVGKVQRIPLAQGWNWFSINLNPVNSSVANVMKYLNNVVNGTIVKTNNSYAQFSNTLNSWNGTLTNIGIEKSYQIFLTAADTLQVVGTDLVDSITIGLQQGWNWVGYPKTEVEDVNTYLARYDEAVSGDEIKSQFEFSSFDGNNWVGALNNMLPGKGYKIRSQIGGDLPVLFKRAAPGWIVDEYEKEFNMNVTAVLKVNGVAINRNVSVGAFMNGVCVGLASIQLVDNNNPRLFITLFGNASDVGNAIEFLVYDSVNDSVYTPSYQPLSFSIDGVNGTIENAFELLLNDPSLLSVANVNIKGYVLYQNQPNPFNDNTIIKFKLPKAEKVQIQVYDYTGKLVSELANSTYDEGTHQVSFQHSNLSKGMYFYQMRAGEFVQTRKMIVQ